MLHSRLTFAEKSDRDKYINALQEHIQNDVSGDITKLEDVLKEALTKISPSQKEGDKLFNNIQLTAVYALEAAFWKEVRDKITPKNKAHYLKLYQELYCTGTVFEAKLKEFKAQGLTENPYLISKVDIQSNPSTDVFEANCEFSKQISALLDAKSDILFEDTKYTLIIEFLSNIDPRILSNIVVNQGFEVKINNKKEVDILHECIECARVIIMTSIDVSKLVLPAGTIAAITFCTLGASLPITVGVGLLIIASELAYLQDRNIKSSIDQTKIDSVKEQIIKKGIDHIYDQQVDILPLDIKEPIRLLNIQSIIKQSIEYIESSYKKHKTKPDEALLEVVNNLSDLMLNIFKKNRSSLKECNKGDLEMFRKHSKELFGIILQPAAQSSP